MTVTESCPECGATMERETGEKARNAVIAHMSSKNDPTHKGIGYQKAENLLGIHSDESGPEPVKEPAATATDGGAQPVPMPENVPDDPNDGPPEKFVPVDEWLSAFEDRNPRTAGTDAWQQQAAEIRERADFVDAEKTDGREVVAVPADEVPA